MLQIKTFDASDKRELDNRVNEFFVEAETYYNGFELKTISYAVQNESGTQYGRRYYCCVCYSYESENM